MVEATARIAPRHLEQLRRSCAEVIVPDDAGYDDARRLWNAIHDRRPAVIARPSTAQEVATAVRFAREHDLEITVRSGGHSAAGLGGANGGLLVDMSAMRGVEVNPQTRTARANGGALLGELDIAAQEHGLVCPTGVIGHTGVAGLTLGGGVGRLQRNFGLTIDNLAAVELVTADGRLVRATETEEPELFWGLRGAGWNFGIATAFEFRLHPFGPDLHRGVLTFPATQVQELWSRFREYAPQRARHRVVHLRPRSRRSRTPATRTKWSASRSSTSPGTTAAPRMTSSATRPALRSGPKPLTTTIGSQPYLEVQTAHDLAFAWGSRSFIKSHNANDVRPEALDELVELHRDRAGRSDLLGHGPRRRDRPRRRGRDRVRRPRGGLRPQRRLDRGPTLRSTTRTSSGAAGRCQIVEPDRTLGAYANGNSDVGPEATRRIYGDAKVARLAALKRTWDPDNMFHVNPNVAPAPDEAAPA